MIGSPFSETLPSCGRITPASVFSSVVFPAPLAPMIATSSPGLDGERGAAEDLAPVGGEGHLARIQAHQATLVLALEAGAVEAELERADADLVSGRDHRSLDRSSVDPGAAGRIQVAQLDHLSALGDRGVKPRHVEVVEDDVVAVVAPDVEHAAAEPNRLLALCCRLGHRGTTTRPSVAYGRARCGTG